MLNLKLKSILGSWEFEIFQQASCWPRYLAVFCGHLISITSPHRIMYANIQHPLCNSAACCPHITQTKFQQNQTSPNKSSKSWRTTDDNWRSEPITSAELWVTVSLWSSKRERWSMLVGNTADDELALWQTNWKCWHFTWERQLLKLVHKDKLPALTVNIWQQAVVS